MRKTAFVKVSGDLVSRKDVIAWIKSLAKDFFTVICIGGGLQINEEFQKRGFPVEFGPLGREAKTFRQRQVARDVLEKNQAQIQDILAKNQVVAIVMIPVLDIGSVLCHVNGDVFLRAAYLGFNRLFVLTYDERVEAKEVEFEDLPKIKVIGFPKN